MTSQTQAPDLVLDEAPPAADGAPPRRSERAGAIVYGAIWVSTLVVAGIILWGDLERATVGVLVLVLMLQLLAVNVPIGLAMVMASVVGFYALGGTRVVVSSLTSQPFDAVASWSLSVVPLFIFLGMVIWRGGLADSAYEATRQWFGKVPGGLAVASNLAGAGLSAGTGSTIGTAYALGRMALPQMFRAGYDVRLATGVIAMAGTLGQIIPPSILLVVYAGIAETPVGPQLLAGIVPGLLLALAYALLVVVRATLKPGLAPRPDLSDVTWGSRLRSLGMLVPLGAVVFVVIGGMYFGFFTATESAAFGVVAALVVSWKPWSRKRLKPREMGALVKTAATESSLSVGGIVFMIIGAVALTRVLAMSGVTRQLTDVLIDLNLSRVWFLILLIAFYMLLGTFIEPLPMMLLTVPILHAPLESMGVDMVWFGVFIVILAEMGIVTPPVGILANVVHRIAQRPEVNQGREVKAADVFKGVLPFLVVVCLVLVALILEPAIVTWLPGSASTR
ncbi:TRAP transporter large permease [Phytohabitans sp. ZYX-F-186]|uniref:TRAP transporter large permease n=1 Tax=Phytohabitans maris TaxID=3071409 RepID=A0ABU0ZD84_9ACTN|nr:TRAP transporter large permease [Phytohabitans sp. ZYX-F-186]MDQ7903892.1 TRAP transporter large permease [Phytohabitans sp. ZYX-F-186]